MRSFWLPSVIISSIYIKFVVWKKNQILSQIIFCSLFRSSKKKIRLRENLEHLLTKNDHHINEKIRKSKIWFFFSTTFYHKITVHASIFPPRTWNRRYPQHNPPSKCPRISWELIQNLVTRMKSVFRMIHWVKTPQITKEFISEWNGFKPIDSLGWRCRFSFKNHRFSKERWTGYNKRLGPPFNSSSASGPGSGDPGISPTISHTSHCSS